MSFVQYAKDVARYAQYHFNKAIAPGNKFVPTMTIPFEESFRAIKTQDHRKLAHAYDNAAYVCAKKIASAVAGVPLKLYVAKPSDKTLRNPTRTVPKERRMGLEKDSTLTRYLTKDVEVVEVMEHPFLDLMANINPYYNYFDFFMLTDLNMELMGNAYWYVVDDKFGLPAELWILPAQYMWVVPDRQEFIKAYVMMRGIAGASGLMRVPFEETEVVHFKEPSPNNIYYGVSWLGAMSEAYNLQVNIDRYDIAFFSNMARPDGILQSPKGTIVTPSVFKQIKQQFLQKYTGVRNALTPMILQGGLEWQNISQPPTDLGLKDSRRDSLERLAMASGVPLAKLITENVNKAVAQAAQLDFLRDTVRPKLTLIQEKINEKLMPRYGEEFFVAFDEIVPEDKELLLKREHEDVKLGIRTRNEVRKARGEKPHPVDGDILPPFPGTIAAPPTAVKPESEPTNGGRKPTATPEVDSTPSSSTEAEVGEKKQTYLYITDNGSEIKAESWERAQMVCDANGKGEVIVGEHVEQIEIQETETETDSEKAHDVSRTKEERDIYWKVFEEVTEPLEKSFRKELVKYFEKQEKQVLANLRKFKSARRVIKVKEGDIDNIIFGANEWKEKYAEDLEKEYIKTVAAAGKQAEGLLPGLSFDVANPEVEKFIGRTLTKTAEDITETTIKKITKQLQTGIANGESIPDLAFRIGEVYEEAVGSRAVMIARTEVVGSYAGGSLEAYKQSDVVERVEWIATRDGRVRDDHLALDGKTIKLGKTFTLGGAPTKGPGLSPIAGESINCRCFVDGQIPIYTDTGWKQIQHIKKGDRVLTHKGHFKKVTGILQDKEKKIWSKYRGDVVRITIAVPSRNVNSSNKKTRPLFITVTPEHPILTDSGFKEAQIINEKDKIITAGRTCLTCSNEFPIVKFRESAADYLPKYCSLSCANSYTAKEQWKNTNMREVVSKKSAEQMKREYANGTRDRFAITKKANEKMWELIKQDKWVLQAGNHTFFPRYFDTDIELKMEAELKKRKIKYKKQRFIAGHSVDFYIPHRKAVIECNGDYWHSPKKQREKDARKRKRIEASGFHVFEYWGSEINKDVSACVNHFEHSILNHTGEYKNIKLNIISIEKWKLKKAKRLYNFSVEDDESYIAKGIITHNCALAPVVGEL